MFVLFVLDCIIIWWPASGRARVCRVWGEVSSWRGRILARPDLAHRDRRLTAVVLFVLPNTRGSGSAVRTQREADGGMRAVAVVGSKGKVGKEVTVVERACSASDRLDTRREAEVTVVCGARDR